MFSFPRSEFWPLQIPHANVNWKRKGIIQELTNGLDDVSQLISLGIDSTPCSLHPPTPPQPPLPTVSHVFLHETSVTAKSWW